MSAAVPAQYVITVETETDPETDPATLAQSIAEQVTTTLKAVPGVSAVQVVGLA